MFHPLAVFFADGAAAFAGLDAGAELRAGELEIGPGEAGDDARRRKADIGAIVAIANALHHLGDVLLAEAGISAGVARFRARITGGDAFDRRGVIRRWVYRVGLEHLFDVTHGKVFLSFPQRGSYSIRCQCQCLRIFGWFVFFRKSIGQGRGIGRVCF